MIDIDVEAKKVYFTQVDRIITGEITSAHVCSCGSPLLVKALALEEIDQREHKELDKDNPKFDLSQFPGGIILLRKKHNQDCQVAPGFLHFSHQAVAQECLKNIMNYGVYLDEEKVKVPDLNPVDPECLKKIMGIEEILDQTGMDPPLYVVNFEEVRKQLYGHGYWPNYKQRKAATKKFMSLLEYTTTPEVKVTIVDDLDKTKRPARAKPEIKKKPEPIEKPIKPKKVIYVEQMRLF